MDYVRNKPFSWSHESVIEGEIVSKNCLLYDYYSSKHFSIILLGFASSPTEGAIEHPFSPEFIVISSGKGIKTSSSAIRLKINPCESETRVIKINVLDANKFQIFFCRCWFVCFANIGMKIFTFDKWEWVTYKSSQIELDMLREKEVVVWGHSRLG